MKCLVTVCSLLFSISLLASSEGQIKYIKLDNVDSIISQKDRKNNKQKWIPILSKRIELDPQNILNLLFPEKIDSLQVRDMYINKEAIDASFGEISIPFTLSVKYVQNILQQGTLNTTGIIYMNKEYPVISGIELLYFSDSQWSEELGRSIGLLDNYGADFLELVVCPTLAKYFQEKEEVQKLHDVSESIVKHLLTSTK
jgi:hypothetical protein